MYISRDIIYVRARVSTLRMRLKGHGTTPSRDRKAKAKGVAPRGVTSHCVSPMQPARKRRRIEAKQPLKVVGKSCTKRLHVGVFLVGSEPLQALASLWPKPSK